MLDSDVRISLYLLTSQLNKISKEYKPQLKTHFRGNAVVNTIIELASSGLVDPSVDELTVRLKLADINDRNCEIVSTQYAGLDKSNLVVEDVRAYFKSCVTNILLSEATNISDVDKYMAEVSRIRALDFGTKNKIDNSVRAVKFKDIDVEKINESIKSAVKSFWKPLNASNAYGGYRTEQLICVCGRPASGKSLFMNAEMIENLKANRHCIYCAIGDLIDEDFITRTAAYVFKVPMNVVILDIEYFKKRLLAELPQIETHLDILFIKPGKLTANDLRTYLDEHLLKNEPSTIFIDYDSNLEGGDNLYAKGGEIYSVAEDIASREGYLVFIATQPKMMVYESECYGMNGVGESGRKLHIPATIITIGKHPTAVNPVGYITVAKQRRGMTFSAPYFRDLNGEFIYINDATKTKLVTANTMMTMITNSSEAYKIEMEENNVSTLGM